MNKLCCMYYMNTLYIESIKCKRMVVHMKIAKNYMKNTVKCVGDINEIQVIPVEVSTEPVED